MTGFAILSAFRSELSCCTGPMERDRAAYLREHYDSLEDVAPEISAAGTSSTTSVGADTSK